MPRIGINIIRPMSAAATPWWLSGGIPAANCIAAYQAKGAATYAASKVNLTGNAAYDLTVGSAPAFDTAVGWTFTGDYLITGIIAAANYSGFVQFSGGSTTSRRALFSGGTNGAGFAIWSTWSTDNKTRFSEGGAGVFSDNQLTSGNVGLAGKKCYENGINTKTIGVGATYGDYTIWIGAQNVNGSPANPYSGNIQAAAFYNVAISDAQALALATAMAAL